MNALIIFIKNIEKGKVKTRLASTLGDEKALEIYQALLGHTRNVATSVDAGRYLYYSSFIEKKDDWSNKDFIKKLQPEGDLGQRLTTAFKEVFKRNEKVVVVGSDCAQLTPDIVNRAFEKLEEYPFVIGPTLDGGYYLLGMKNFEPSVFENIEWSTESVFSATLKKIQALHCDCYLLEELSDIDYEEDWKKYGWELPSEK